MPAPVGRARGRDERDQIELRALEREQAKELLREASGLTATADVLGHQSQLCVDEWDPRILRDQPGCAERKRRGATRNDGNHTRPRSLPARRANPPESREHGNSNQPGRVFEEHGNAGCCAGGEPPKHRAACVGPEVSPAAKRWPHTASVQGSVIQASVCAVVQ